MKIFIYFVLIIAFLMFYQQSPMFAMVILLGFLGVFLFYKMKKRKRLSYPGTLLSGTQNIQSSNTNELLMLLMLQQPTKSEPRYPDHDYTSKEKENPHHQYIEKTKNEILDLLDS